MLVRPLTVTQDIMFEIAFLRLAEEWFGERNSVFAPNYRLAGQLSEVKLLNQLKGCGYYMLLRNGNKDYKLLKHGRRNSSIL